MFVRVSSGELEVDIVLSDESENTEDTGEGGLDSGRLKEREKVVLDGGVVIFEGEVWPDAPGVVFKILYLPSAVLRSSA